MIDHEIIFAAFFLTSHGETLDEKIDQHLFYITVEFYRHYHTVSICTLSFY